MGLEVASLPNEGILSDIWRLYVPMPRRQHCNDTTPYRTIIWLVWKRVCLVYNINLLVYSNHRSILTSSGVIEVGTYWELSKEYSNLYLSNIYIYQIPLRQDVFIPWVRKLHKCIQPNIIPMYLECCYIIEKKNSENKISNHLHDILGQKLTYIQVYQKLCCFNL